MHENDGIISLSDASEEYQEEFMKYFNTVEALFPRENLNQMKFKGDVLTNLLTSHIFELFGTTENAMHVIDVICESMKRAIKTYEK